MQFGKLEVWGFLTKYSGFLNLNNQTHHEVTTCELYFKPMCKYQPPSKVSEELRAKPKIGFTLPFCFYFKRTSFDFSNFSYTSNSWKRRVLVKLKGGFNSSQEKPLNSSESWQNIRKHKPSLWCQLSTMNHFATLALFTLLFSRLPNQTLNHQHWGCS